MSSVGVLIIESKRVGAVQFDRFVSFVSFARSQS